MQRKFVSSVMISVIIRLHRVKPNAPINNAYRIKQRDARECIRLRYCLLKTCITSIMEYREATQTLIQDNATVLGNESLKTDIYLCQIPLKELGPCFHEVWTCFFFIVNFFAFIPSILFQAYTVKFNIFITHLHLHKYIKKQNGIFSIKYGYGVQSDTFYYVPKQQYSILFHSWIFHMIVYIGRNQISMTSRTQQMVFVLIFWEIQDIFFSNNDQSSFAVSQWYFTTAQTKILTATVEFKTAVNF